MARPPASDGSSRFNMGGPDVHVKGSIDDAASANSEANHVRSSINMSGKPFSEASLVIKCVQPFSTAAAR